MKYKLIIILISIMLLFTNSPDDIYSQPQTNKSKIKIKKIEARKLEQEIESINSQLISAVENYNEIRLKLSNTSDNISKNVQQINSTQKKLSAKYRLLNKRVNSIYKHGLINFVEVLLDSNSFVNFVNRWVFLSEIIKHDNGLIQNIKSLKSNLLNKKIELEKQKSKQLKLSSRLEVEKILVEKTLFSRKSLYKTHLNEIAALEKKQKEIDAKLQREALAKALLRKQEEARRKAQAVEAKESIPSPGDPDSATASRVINIAMQYLGVPYKWGGSSPAEGFDCSGFTSYVYRQVGIYLPHSSRAQFGIGTPVPRSELKPADLVFFGSPISHVSIYIGNDSMIDAPQTGDVVRIRSFSRHRNYTGARRLL